MLLAGVFDRVVASDASAAQLAHATRHPRVRYVLARAEHEESVTGIAAASVDLCVAAQAAHWFDMDGYVRQVRRVARPGALVALVSYNTLEIGNDAADRVVRDFYGGDLARYWPPERRHVEDGGARLPWPFAPVPMPVLAIERRWDLAALLGYLETWSAVGALRSAPGGVQVLARFRAALGVAWGDPAAKFDLRFPLAVRAGRVA